ncbi:zinc metalloprotease [Barnesiella viscericola DSM 18177]|uniref:Zinc metalloprotease n=1 Tax=Barnesiella viscericola DSM 18177 TaxID=880074 RepID=W0EPV2_9BACT|nr:RIP metalloprotease RseP [Barnesiella viscericola]AHF11583.1 zinc metalloprotease [Barnesiella viscericola DSM 18177]
METFLIKTVQLLLSLSILVIVHEFGHFIFARMFKVRVEKFYLFFDPWFSLFKFKPKNSHTEYGIGWLPLGGYVKIAGMIDESMDREQMKQPAQPWEFRSKPAWQRLLIMVAGVVFNFILAVFIYSMIAYTWGTSYIPFKNAYAGMEYCQSARDIGFQNGDIPLTADGATLDFMSSETLQKIVEAREVEVLRGTDTVSIAIPQDFMLRLIDKEEQFAMYRIPPVVYEAADHTGAQQAGLQKGDRIESINGKTTPSLDELHQVLANYRDTTVTVAFLRNGVQHSTQVKTDSVGALGILISPLSESYEVVTEHYGFWESFPKGIELGVDKLTSYVSSMKYVFTKEGAQSLGGFGAIGSIFPEQWNWEAFWSMTAFLSVILAFMNILPIPALDGGHVLFLLYEVITRRKPNDKFMEYAQMCGMIFLLLLLVYANGNDIFRFFFK